MLVDPITKDDIEGVSVFVDLRGRPVVFSCIRSDQDYPFVSTEGLEWTSDGAYDLDVPKHPYTLSRRLFDGRPQARANRLKLEKFMKLLLKVRPTIERCARATEF